MNVGVLSWTVDTDSPHVLLNKSVPRRGENNFDERGESEKVSDDDEVMDGS